MKLFEIYDAPIQGFQDINSDQSRPAWKQSRKTKLTLKQIRKLRQMLDVRNYEEQSYMKKVHEQYGVAAEGAEQTPQF